MDECVEVKPIGCGVEGCSNPRRYKVFCCSHYKKARYAENPEKHREEAKKRRATNPQKRREADKRYRDAHPDKNRERNRKREVNNPERSSVRSHHKVIFNPNSPAHKNYKGMPFFDAWNRDMGGSFNTGAQWIIDNLGKRPTDGKWQLHIDRREIGFVPGNLTWTPQEKHVREEMLAKTLAENATLRETIAALEARLRPSTASIRRCGTAGGSQHFR